MPDGVLVIDKPAGITSHDVVDVVRRRLATKKVGHGGTLDPDATGVLVVGVGRATRLLSYAQGAPKRYTAVGRLGVQTTTQDASGEVLERRPVDVDAHTVEKALEGFTGEIEQVPPMVSAVKIGGERLYKKARRGEEIERRARSVTIYDARVVDFEAPDVTLDISCSAGTYVRTLIHDFGAALGCGAHLLSLRRTEAGGHRLDDAIDLESVDVDALRPLVDALAGMRRIEVDRDRALLVHDGRPLDPIDFDVVPGQTVAVVHEGQLLAVYRATTESLRAERVLPRQET